MTKPKSLAALAITALFLAACGSSGSVGDILGGGGSQASNYEIRGVVDHVDTSSRSVYLTNVSGYSSMLSSGGSSGNNVRVYYDDQTQVRFGGQSYRPEDLERGDEVSVNVAESGNALVADVVTVTRDVSNGTSSGTSYPGTGTIGSTVRGTVRYVDTSRRTIEVDRGYGSTVIVEYASNTPVYFNGRNFMVADLERGDEIEISGRDLGSGRYSANDITVTRSISGTSSSGSTSSSYRTVRGTVSYVDTSRRTIELESPSWSSNFTGSTSNNRVVVQYDAGMNIDVAGRMQAISGLERGDVIEVQVDNTGGSVLHATKLWLVRDVNNR